MEAIPPESGGNGAAERRAGTSQFPPTFEFIVTPELSGVRVDSFLVKHLRNYNPWRMARIARAGGVDINLSRAGESDRVYVGQRVRVRLLEPPDKLLAAMDVPLPVVFRDPWILVVNKPAGMISHPVGEFTGSTVANAAQWLLDEAGPARGLLRPGLVHRLDRETSGLMVLALTHDAHVPLAAAFENSRVSKEYLAIVEGVPAHASGTFDWSIGRATTGRHVLMSCQPDALEQRAARTAWDVIENFPSCTLVRAKPRTGRNHQIRVHFAHAGHPLVGDQFYEAGGKFKPFQTDRGEDDEPLHFDPVTDDRGAILPIQRHALHAASLRFAHPITGAWLEFESTPPEDFEATLQHFRARSV